jgi:hypothetical protein
MLGKAGKRYKYKEGNEDFFHNNSGIVSAQIKISFLI